MSLQPGKRALGFFLCGVMGLLVMSIMFLRSASFAEPSTSKILGISASPQGDLVLRVEGEGFDPILRLETTSPTKQTPAGVYRIVLQGLGVKLDSQSAGSLSHLNLDLVERLPAIEKVQWTESTTQQVGQQPGFQLALISWRKLQPQVLSNSGQEIVIRLLGDHSAPPAVLAHRRVLAQLEQVAREKKAKLLELAEQRRQAELKRQEEARMRTEEDRIIRMQQQADQERLAELRQQQLQNMAALKATLRRRHLHEVPLTLTHTKGEPHPYSSSLANGSGFSRQERGDFKTSKTENQFGASIHGEPTPQSGQIQFKDIQSREFPASRSDWQNAYVAPSVQSKPKSPSIEEALPQIQTTLIPSVQPVGAADIEFAPLTNYEADPTGPLHLKKPPSDFAPDPDEPLIGPPRPR